MPEIPDRDLELGGRIDLLLTDGIMPIKVLLMSGYQTSDVAGSGRPFLAKPFSIDGLAHRARDVDPAIILRPANKGPAGGPVGTIPAGQ